jgi:SAM-dependent methyltransferase
MSGHPEPNPELATQRAEWSALGRRDPLWAIVSERSKRGGRWALPEFLATGGLDVDAILATAHALGRPVSHRAALDFGCGVGRLTLPLALAFERVVGVDIATPMIEQARDLARGRDNVEFVVGDASGRLPFADGTFDLVLSIHVLQHLPAPALALEQLVELARVVAPDGLLVVQLPGPIPLRHRLQLRRRAYAILRRLGLSERVLFDRLGLHPMRLIGLPPQDVRAALQQAGLDILTVSAGVLLGSRMDSFTYYAIPRRTG